VDGGAPAEDFTTCGQDQVCRSGACVPTRPVTGNRTVTYWPDGAARTTQAAPVVGVSAEIRAASGTWRTYPGTAGGGSVTIPGVPEGSYWLKLDDGSGVVTFVETSASTLDLGYDKLGRAGKTPAGASAQVDFALSLPAGDTWAAGHQMQVVSSNADVWDWLTTVTTAPNGRSGTWRDNWFAGNASAAPLNQVTTADPFSVFHLRSTSLTPTQPYLWASTISIAPNVAIPPATNPVSRTLSTANLPAQRTLAGGTWYVRNFEGLRGAMNASSGAGSHTLSVGANVGALDANGPAASATPSLLSMVAASVTADLVFPSLNYVPVLSHAQMAATWYEWRGVEFTASVSRGATNPATIPVSVGRREPLSPAPTTPLSPTLVPVASLSFRTTSGATLGAYVDRQGVGPTPTLSWSPPPAPPTPPTRAPLSPTRYEVEVFRLTGSTSPRSTLVARFVTAGLEAPFPSGVLQPGSSYCARVTARSYPSDAVTTAPFRRMNVGAWAQTITGVFSP
jgi:hypothetical protein